MSGERGWTLPDNVVGQMPAFSSRSEGDAIIDVLLTGEPEDAEVIPAVARATNWALGVGATRGITPPKVEFLALRILEGEAYGKHVVLGSPIFVAEL